MIARGAVIKALESEQVITTCSDTNNYSDSEGTALDIVKVR